MLNMKNYIEPNGASLTVDVKDNVLTGEKAKEDIEKLITKMELENRGVILFYSASGPMVTVRIKGESEKIQDFYDALKNDGKYRIIRKISLAY